MNMSHILSCSEHEPAQCACTSSSERCTNKGADRVVCRIMNAIIQTENTKIK